MPKTPESPFAFLVAGPWLMPIACWELHRVHRRSVGNARA